VRILEFDREISHARRRGGASRSASLAVELWDCSGDQQYEACWPAILAGVVGVILVYNPETPSHEREIAKWYGAFIAKLRLGEQQLLLLAHHKNPGGDSDASIAPAAPRE
jgi:Rab-like protein 5